MTDQSFPITPSPELRDQWRREASRSYDGGVCREEWFMDRAAQWGADQELEACCEWLVSKLTFREDGIRFADELRAARRPETPSLKEQAIAELEKVDMLWDTTEFSQDTLDSLDTIRRALEALPND